MEQIFWDNFKNTDKLLILDYVGRLPLIYQKALQDCYGEDYNELLKKGVKLTDAKKAIKKINYLINNPNYYVRATNYNTAKNLNGEIKVFSGKQKKVYLKEKLNCDENTIKRISIIFRLNPEFKILYKYFGINLDESIDEFELSREDYETLKKIYKNLSDFINNKSLLVRNVLGLTYSEFAFCFEKELTINPKLKKIKLLCKKNIITEPINLLDIDDKTFLNIIKCIYGLKPIILINKILASNKFNITLQEFLDATEKEMNFILEKNKNTDVGKTLKNLWQDDYTRLCIDKNNDSINELVTILNVLINDLFSYRYLIKVKTLQEILEATEEEIDFLKNNLSKETSSYKIISKVFGSNFRGTNELRYMLHGKDNEAYHNALLNLKLKLSNYRNGKSRKFKTLQELLGATEEEIDFLKKYINDNYEKFAIIIKVFGKELNGTNEFYKYLSAEEKVAYSEKIHILRINLQKFRTGKLHEYKKLKDILNVSEEEIEHIKKYYPKTTKGYQILLKVFGENLDNDDSLYCNLLEKEKNLYRYTLQALNRFLKDGIKKYKTLQEILEATEEEMEFLKQKYPKNTKNYILLIKVFGNNFENSNYNYDKLNGDEKKKYRSALKSIRKFLEKHRKNLIKNGKTLAEIIKISPEEIEYIKQQYPKNTKNYKIIVKVFGIELKDTNEKLNCLTDEERKTYYNALNCLKRFIKRSETKCKPKTLQELLNATEKEIDFLNKKISKKTKTYTILSKVFGNDFKKTNECYDSLTTLEKRTFSQTIIRLKSLLEKYRETKKFDFKTLSQILGATKEEIEFLMDEADKSSKIYKVILKVFGEDFEGTNEKKFLLNNEEKKTYNNAISSLKARLKNYRKNKNIKYKTLQEILEATEEEIDFLSEITPKKTKNYVVLVKVFGESFKGTNELFEQLTDEEKVTYFAAIKSLSVRLKKYRDNGKDYKTLQEILNATNEEIEYLNEIYPQNTRSYQFLVSMFGIDFRNIGNLNKLSSEANMLLNDTIAILQTYLCMQRENTKDGNLQQIETEGPAEILTSKEYITVETPFKHPFFKEFLMLLPIEYQYITALRLGLIYDEKIHSIEELAEIFNIDIETARERCSKGINIFILIIERYKELYNQNVPNIDALIENIKLVL